VCLLLAIIYLLIRVVIMRFTLNDAVRQRVSGESFDAIHQRLPLCSSRPTAVIVLRICKFIHKVHPLYRPATRPYEAVSLSVRGGTSPCNQSVHVFLCATMVLVGAEQKSWCMYVSRGVVEIGLGPLFERVTV
jgi:hypothetical protein